MDDHATQGVDHLDAFIQSVCAPLRKRTRGQELAVDDALSAHIKHSVRCLSSDGAKSERSILFLAAQMVFKRVAHVIRDSAHAIRIAIKDPLHHDTLFGQVWEELFNKKHALVHRSSKI